MSVMCQEDYYSFKQDLIELGFSLPTNALNDLVGHYEHVINSKRRSSSITTLSDLIALLEKRDHIKEDDFSSLEQIVNHLPNKEDKERMLARINRPRRHQDINESYNSFTNVRHTDSIPASHVDSGTTILSEEVLQCISEGIGRKWKDLARKLKLREGDLDAIQKKYSDNWNQCAYECLILFQQRCDRHNLKSTLMQALLNARRQDLQKKVEQLML